MKFIFNIVLLVFCLNSFCQNDSFKKIYPINKTGFGKPIGEIISKSIGAEGGTIISADGIASLQIPPNALQSITKITVQPNSNMAHGAKGDAYSFEPTGLQFLKPAILTINSTDSEKKQNKNVPQKIIWQDTSGAWHRIKNSKFDSIQGFVSAEISHFSDYTRQPDYTIDPESAELFVGESQGFQLQLYDILPDKYQIMIEELEMNYEEVIKLMSKNDITWKVNGKVGGDAISGYVSPNPNFPLAVIYHAPLTVPSIDPVKIEAHISGKIYTGGTSHVDGASTYATVTIMDEYNFTFIGYSTSGVLHMIDSSSCKIAIKGTEVRVFDIHNYPPWSDWPSKAGGCSYTYPNKAAWKGLVEITGMAYGIANAGGNITVGEGINQKLTHVSISLLPAVGNTPIAISKCPGYTTTVPSGAFPAMPQTIEFDMDGYDAIIKFGGLKGRNELRHIVNGEGFIIRMQKIVPTE